MNTNVLEMEIKCKTQGLKQNHNLIESETEKEPNETMQNIIDW